MKPLCKVKTSIRFPLAPLWCALVVTSLFISLAHGAASDVAKELTEKGAKLSEKDGIVTGFELSDCSKWTDDDFKKAALLTHVKTLSLGTGLTDEALAQLSNLPDVETISTNSMRITDEGMKPVAKWKKLHSIAFFHPGKFSGTGFAYLADLPELQKVTVAGSSSFGDEGLAAVAKLPHLQEFRSWHHGLTPEGVAKFKELKELKGITLGQRLSYSPPVCVSDQTLAVLSEIKSLESIGLMEARLSLTALMGLKKLPKLKHLTLDGVDIPESDIERLRKELPDVQIKWTAPNEANLKRINALFGAPNAEKR